MDFDDISARLEELRKRHREAKQKERLAQTLREQLEHGIDTSDENLNDSTLDEEHHDEDLSESSSVSEEELQNDVEQDDDDDDTSEEHESTSETKQEQYDSGAGNWSHDGDASEEPEPEEEQETGDPEFDNILAKLKELKAKKIVLSFELNQGKNRLDESKEHRQELSEEATRVYMELVQTKMNILNYMIDSTALDEMELIQEFEQEQQALEKTDTVADESDDDGSEGGNRIPEERKELWKKLQQTKITYKKLLKFVELNETILNQCKMDKEEMNVNKHNVSVKYEAEISKLDNRRAESEQQTAEYKQLFKDIKEQNEEKRRELNVTHKKIEKTQKRTARELQFMAKQLLK